MKRLLIFTLSLSCTLSALGQNPTDSIGFTNKAEAKNLTIDGKKEGKWISYEDDKFNSTADTNAPYYALVVYKTGHQIGTIRKYYKSGKLCTVNPCTVDGIKNGMSKAYYENGKLEGEVPYTNDKKNGVMKIYYENGKLKSESTFVNDKLVKVKNYGEKGKEIK
jgi:antitoxin component YwqK of YwqJK toxin-antitoxin module